MASFKQTEYCTMCKKTVTSDTGGNCKLCGNKTDKSTWSVRFRVIEDGKERNKRFSGFETKKAANQAYVEFMSSYVAPKQSSKECDLTMNQLFGLYLSYIRDRIKISTQYTIQKEYNYHIKETFGTKQIRKITKLDILSWQNSLNAKNYKYKTKTKLRGFLSAILKYAVMYYDLPSNPVMMVEQFRRVNEPKKIMNVWSVDDFNKFISTIDDKTYTALFYTLFYTGCRKSEAFALNWNDLDFKENKITFNKTLTRKIENAPYAILPTTKFITGDRKILMPKPLVSILTDYMRYQDTTSAFVFGGNKPLAENSVTRILKKHSGIAKVPPIHEHEFRHSHASYLISKGASIVLVAQRLGHANIEETLNTYSHLMPNDEERVVELLN